MSIEAICFATQDAAAGLVVACDMLLLDVQIVAFFGSICITFIGVYLVTSDRPSSPRKFSGERERKRGRERGFEVQACGWGGKEGRVGRK